MDIAVLAQLLSSLGTLVVAAGILYQGRQARNARNDTDRPQIIVDADYTGRFTTNIVVRNIGHGVAKNITFGFSAPLETTSGHDVPDLTYFKHGTNFPARPEGRPTAGAVWPRTSRSGSPRRSRPRAATTSQICRTSSTA